MIEAVVAVELLVVFAHLFFLVVEVVEVFVMVESVVLIVVTS